MTQPLVERHDGRCLVVYAFHVYDRNVRFFMRHGLRVDPRVDYCVVQNLPEWGEESRKVKQYRKSLGTSGLTWMYRCNRNNDFGAYSEAVNSVPLDAYDYFVFVNSTMRGPFVPTSYPSDVHWTAAFTRRLSNAVALVGATINYYHGTNPHVQSMLMCMDRRGVDLYRKDGIFFGADKPPMPKGDMIRHHEIGGSRLILQHGYNLDCLLLALQGRNWHETQTFEPYAPDEFDFWGNRMYYGYNIHPYETLFMKTNRPFDMGDTIVNMYTLWMERQDGYEAGVLHPVEEWLRDQDFLQDDAIERLNAEDKTRRVEAPWVNTWHSRERWVWASVVTILLGLVAVFLTLWILKGRR